MSDSAPQTDSETQLLEFLRASDQRALKLVLEQHGPAVRAMLKKIFASLMNDADVDDALSVALLRLWVARDRYDPSRGSLRTWLFYLARNYCLDVLRARTREPAAQARQLSDALVSPNAPLLEPQHSEMTRRVAELFETELNETEQQVLRAYIRADGAGNWASELAKQLPLSAQHIRVIRLRAVQKLRRKLEDRASGESA
jgi:RNA polymerase sigma-70 factor (ECF subfamily)